MGGPMGPPMGGPPMGGHMGMPPMQSGMAPAVGQSGLYDPSGSSAVSVPKKSNVGIIVGIILLLAAGGGIAAFVLLGNKDKDKKNDAAGSGSDRSGQVASNGSSGSSGGGEQPDHQAGGNPDKATTPDAAVADKPDPDNSGSAGSNADSGSGGGGSADTGSGGTSVTPAAETIDVLLITNADVFEVWEGGKKVFDGPDNLPITKGTPRTVTLKSKGFKDKTITVDGKTRKLKTKLTRIPGQTGTTSTNTNTGGTNAGKMDCTKKIVDGSNAACRKQYCKAHPDVAICETLDDE
jgi:hypothetical protein